MSSKMPRSVFLDFLRIVAITLVFIAHLGQHLNTTAGSFFGIKNFYYVSLGGVGVSMFLILSGLLAGLVDCQKKTGYLLYMLKKILRIYPLYFMSIPLSIAGYVAGSLLLEGDYPEPFPNGFTTDVIGSLTGFYSWVGLWGGPYNPPSWFISLIMVMYAITFPIIFAVRRWPHLTIGVLFLVSMASRYYIGQYGVPFLDRNVFEHLEGWVYRQFGFMPGRPTDWFPLCRIFEFGLGIYLSSVVPKSFWFRLQLPYTRPVSYLSDLAFPLFLIHYPFIFLVVWLHDLSVPVWAAITLFILFIVLLSHQISWLDNRIPRKIVLSSVV